MLDKGYKSIGDFHSTIPSTGGGERDGRWNGQQKSECGLHKDYFKLKRAAQSKNSDTFKIRGDLQISLLVDFLDHHASTIGSLGLKFIEYSLNTGVHFEFSSPLALISIPDSLFTKPKEAAFSKQDTFIVTAIASGPITYNQFSSLVKMLPQITKIGALDTIEDFISVLEFEIIPSSDLAPELSARLFEFGQMTKIDAIIQPNNVFRKQKRLVIFDMDSTLIQQEVIDELAREAGVYEKIAAITESAM